MSSPVYALNLFNITNKEEYLAYSRRSAKEVQAHGGRVLALGRFRESAAGQLDNSFTTSLHHSIAPGD